VQVERLFGKGWIQPLRYRDSVYLFLPSDGSGGHDDLARDWNRRPIRIAADGRVFAGPAWREEDDSGAAE
jgi:hypothetical protein